LIRLPNLTNQLKSEQIAQFDQSVEVWTDSPSWPISWSLIRLPNLTHKLKSDQIAQFDQSVEVWTDSLIWPISWSLNRFEVWSDCTIWLISSILLIFQFQIDGFLTWTESVTIVKMKLNQHSTIDNTRDDSTIWLKAAWQSQKSSATPK
jgi:hypothetical protein